MPIINKKIHTNPQDLKKRLKIILKSYKKMNAATIRQLKCIGFIVKKGRKHCRIYREGQPRKCYFISTTASDRKTGANAAAIMSHLWLL